MVPPWLGAIAGLIVTLCGVLLVVMGTREIRGARALAEHAAGDPGAIGDHFGAVVLGVVALSVGLLLTLASLLGRSRQGPRISPR